MNTDIRAELETALRLHREGRNDEAEGVCGRVMAVAPNCGEAWHLFGMLRHQAKDFQAAVDAIGRAIVLDGTQAVFFNNYGAALQSLRRCPDAVTAYRAALQVWPEYLDALVNLARTLNQLGQPEPAYRLARQALDAGGAARSARRSSRRSEMATGSELATGQLLNEGARSARACGKIADAATWLEELVDVAAAMPDKFTPADLCDMHHRLGTALYRLNRPAPAVKHLETALRHDPANAKSWFFLGLAQQALHHPAAQSSLLRACELEPTNEAWRKHTGLAEEQVLAKA